MRIILTLFWAYHSIVNPDPEIDGTISNSNPDANMASPGQFYFEYSPEFFDRYEIGFMTIHLFLGPPPRPLPPPLPLSATDAAAAPVAAEPGSPPHK